MAIAIFTSNFLHATTIAALLSGTKAVDSRIRVHMLARLGDDDDDKDDDEDAMNEETSLQPLRSWTGSWNPHPPKQRRLDRSKDPPTRYLPNPQLNR